MNEPEQDASISAVAGLQSRGLPKDFLPMQIHERIQVIKRLVISGSLREKLCKQLLQFVGGARHLNHLVITADAERIDGTGFVTAVQNRLTVDFKRFQSLKFICLFASVLRWLYK